MAIVTRVNGDSNGVVVVDVGVHGTGIGGIISTGIGKAPVAYKIVVGGSLQNEMGPNGAVETLLKQVELNSTLLMYQVQNDTSGQVSVLVEGFGWTDATLQTQLRSLGNVGANAVQFGATTVSSNNGFKLA